MPKKTQKARTVKPEKISPKQKLTAALTILDTRKPNHGGLGVARDDSTDLGLASMIDGHDGVRKAIDALVECLQATRSYYSPYAKTLCSEPDYATRMGAARTLIEQRIGKAIVRQQILIGAVESEDQLKQKLVESPALRDRVLKLVKDVQDQSGVA